MSGEQLKGLTEIYSMEAILDSVAVGSKFRGHQNNMSTNKKKYIYMDFHALQGFAIRRFICDITILCFAYVLFLRHKFWVGKA